MVFASPTPSETAAILAPPEGWPDITDELAEVRFSTLQGFDDDVRDEVLALHAKYPGHPEVHSLAADLGVELEGTAPTTAPPEAALATAPPEVAPSEAAPPKVPPAPIAKGSTRPPSLPPPGADAAPGAPEPAAPETSDDLLGDESFDELETLDGQPDLEIIEQLDLTEPDPPAPPSPRLDAAAMIDEVSGVHEEPEPPANLIDANPEAPARPPARPRRRLEEEPPDFVDRTVMVSGLQPPKPFGGAEPPSMPTDVTAPPEADEIEDEPEYPSIRDRRTTLAPDIALDGRATLVPGFLDPDDDEHSVTLPPGELTVGSGLEAPITPDNVSTFVGTRPGLQDDEDEPSAIDPASPATLPPAGDASPQPLADPKNQPPPEGMTAPAREADSASASGAFRVSDLGLDDLPDLDALSTEDEAEAEAEAGGSGEGTVVIKSPVPPAPFGQKVSSAPVAPVRLVMLGPRGEAVAERRIELEGFLDVGRQPGEPWAEDRRMEALHARLFPGAGGVVVDDFGRPSGVYTQIIDTIVVDDGDEFKVGQARLALQRLRGPGPWGQLTMVRHDSPTPENYPLERNEILIGREDGDIVLPADTFVSGDHCRFLREGNAVYLEDLGSSNGTYIRVRAGQCVAFGGLLLVGHTQFRVLAG